MSEDNPIKPKKHKKVLAELSPEEREKKRKYQREYNKKPRMREYRRQYDASARGKVRGAKWRESPQGKAYRKGYNQREGTKTSARIRARALREEAMIAYSENGTPQCACCGETNVGFLSIDHVDNNGAEHRRLLKSAGKCGPQFWRQLKKAGWPRTPPLQVLCYNCNMGRQNNCGICPHHGLVDQTKSKVAKSASEVVMQEPFPLFDNLEGI